MEIINTIMAILISLLDTLLPALGVPDSFFVTADTAFASFVTIIQGASFFVPLDIMVVCFGIMLLADNFALILRVGQFILKLIRG